METLHFTATAEEGKLIIDVPKSLNGKEFNITAVERNMETEEYQRMIRKEKIKRLEQFFGSAKYPDTPIDKYEWYEQAGDY